jgi:Zn-finger nucleic acid-binding protein
MDKNRELHELLGKEWHESTPEIRRCRGVDLDTGEIGNCRITSDLADNNPDYAADPRLVIRGMEEKGLLDEFVWHTNDYYRIKEEYEFSERMDFVVRTEYILDTLGKLRDLAIEFLRGGGVITND